MNNGLLPGFIKPDKIYARIKQTVQTTLTNNSVDYKVLFDSPISDKYSLFAPELNGFKIPPGLSGVYEIIFQAMQPVESINSSVYELTGWIVVNGVKVMMSRGLASGNGWNGRCVRCHEPLISLAENDVVTFVVNVWSADGTHISTDPSMTFAFIRDLA